MERVVYWELTGFSVRVEVGGRILEVGSEGVTRAAGANLLGGPGGMLPRETFKT